MIFLLYSFTLIPLFFDIDVYEIVLSEKANLLQVDISWIENKRNWRYHRRKKSIFISQLVTMQNIYFIFILLFPSYFPFNVNRSKCSKIYYFWLPIQLKKIVYFIFPTKSENREQYLKGSSGVFRIVQCFCVTCIMYFFKNVCVCTGQIKAHLDKVRRMYHPYKQS